MQTIYCVEDDDGIREMIAYAVGTTGMTVREFSDGAGLETALQHELPAMILLDIMLPDKDGIEILADIRNNDRTRNIPVILITAKDSEADKINGLDLGADDYITKPFSVLEMLSRINAVLRRANREITPPADMHGIVIDRSGRRVSVDGKEIQLTYKEFELLSTLAEKPGEVINRDYLLLKVWGFDFEGESRTIDVHIGSLRHKLGDKSKCIETVRNVGYRFVG